MPNMALGKVPLCMTHIRLKWAVNEDGAHKMTIGIRMANGQIQVIKVYPFSAYIKR